MKSVRNTILVSLVILVSLSTSGQIRYSDIFSLLNDGKYRLAEPFLKKYLTENTDNANAYLYMGKIYEERITSSSDVQKIKSYVDSALFYYYNTQSRLTQKEIDQYKEYYQKYRSRDLKTGKMGIKLSDVQHDVENRINNLSVISKAIETPPQRILKTENERPVTEEPKPLSKSAGIYHALLIGISDYDSTALNLEHPVLDAKALKKILIKEYEFEEATVYTLLNPSRQQILIALYSLRKKISPVDNLLIFYAGHGFWDADANQGYWWPRDASPENPSNWLSNSDIREQIRGIKSAHTLLISDACFSGGILKVRGASSIRDAPLDIASLYKLPSRRAITSGTMTEVPDRSVFFSYLLKRLTSNTEKYISSQSLFDSFKKAVINNSLIVPQDGVIADTGDEGGDFIFIRKKN
jgi:hypothetical protein